MDTVVEFDCVTEMVKVAEGDEKIGAVQARLMLWEDLTPIHSDQSVGALSFARRGSKINSIGNEVHFLGFGFGSGHNEVWRDKDLTPVYSDRSVGALSLRHTLKLRRHAVARRGGKIAYPSGAAVLFRAEVLRNIGLFDEEIWMYNEDEDIGWRIWLAGYKCVLAKDAVCYHKYEFSRSIKKYYWMDRNRIIVILKNYHWLTLILILPALIIMELGLIIFSLKNKMFQEKLRVYKYFLKPASWKHIFEERRNLKQIRKIKDRDIVKMFQGEILHQETDSALLRFANIFLNLYWQIVKRIIIW